MSDLEHLEKKKAELKEQQAEIDRQIEATKAQQEQDRQIDLAGLYHRMDSIIKTAASSFSDISMGEVIEYDYDLVAAEAYSRTIDIEISGRYVEERDPSDEAYSTGLGHIAKIGNRSWASPTLVISYLIPFDLVNDDPFFKKWTK